MFKKTNILSLMFLSVVGIISIAPQQVWAQKQDGKVIGEITPAPSQPALAPSQPRIRRRAPVQWLSLRRQFSIVDPRLGEVPVDPATNDFFDNENIKLKFNVSQDGYVYIINYTVKNDGKFTTPTLVGLSTQKIPKFKTMEYRSRLSPPSGREVFVLLYSREPRTELTNLVARSQDKSNIVVPDSILFDLIQKSHVTVTKREPLIKASTSSNSLTGEFVTVVQNNLAKNLDLLIDRFEFKHK